MKLSKNIMSVLALVVVVGAVFMFSGCAATCGAAEKTSAPVKAAGTLRGAMGVDDCEKSSSPLFIEKVMPGQIVVGKPYQYTIHVSNNAKCVLTDVVVTEEVPEQYDLQTATPQPTKTSGRVSQWALGSLKSGETRVITITGAAKSAGSTVSCTKAEYNTLLCLGPRVGIPALLLEAIDVVDPIQVGGIEKYYVTVTNQGQVPDTNIVIAVGFEKQLDYVSAAGPTKPATVDAKKVVFAPLASLAPGQKATWEVVAKANSVGDHRTSVKMTSDMFKRSVDETESTNIY